MSNTSKIVVTLPGGRKVNAQVGHHIIHTDQPIDNGGTDSAPSPFELFLASLGTCAGIFVQGFCSKRNIPFSDIRIEETLDYDEAGVLVGVNLELKLPESFPPKYKEAIVTVVEQCSVKRAIMAQPAFRVRAQTQESAMAAS